MATFSYDPTLQGLKDEARMRIGDTGAIRDESGDSTWFVTDEAITATIEKYGFSEGVAILAESLAAEYAHQPDSYTDDAGTQIKWSSRIDALNHLAASMRSEASKDIYASGGSYHVGQIRKPDTSGLTL